MNVVIVTGRLTPDDNSHDQGGGKLKRVRWIYGILIVFSCSFKKAASKMSRRHQGSRARRPHRESHFQVEVPMIRLNPNASLRPSSPPPLPHGYSYRAEGIFAPICQDLPARSTPPSPPRLQSARRSGPTTRPAAPSAKISIGKRAKNKLLPPFTCEMDDKSPM